MQRVSSFLPSWEKRSSSSAGSKSGLFGWSSTNRSSTSTNASLSHGLARLNLAAANANGERIQKEFFWPATLDNECDKAARIIKSFCSDGYLSPLDNDATTPTEPSATQPSTPVRVPKKIPKRIIQNAAGIAVFTCMRNGLWMTGSGGSGILIARKSDGTWSPPSGIMLHTPTLSFIIGVDIYDCVLVINNLAALESITRSRVVLGEDVGLTQGPRVPLDSNETDVNVRELGNTVLTYMKARGQEQRVNLNGCILTERSNENERFYHSGVSQMDILSGSVTRHVQETQPLFEVIKMAEGRTDFDTTIIKQLAIEPAPGDAMIATPLSPTSPRGAFGVPNTLDPDPFGILALEMAGLEIREAGSRLRPASSQFDFNPRPMSPASSRLNGVSVASSKSRRSKRGSTISNRTIKSVTTDAGTQTNVNATPNTSPSPGLSDEGHSRAHFDHRRSFDNIKESKEEEDDIDYTTVDLTPLDVLGTPSPVDEEFDPKKVQKRSSKLQIPSNADDDDKASKASSNYGEDGDDRASKDGKAYTSDDGTDDSDIDSSDADDEDDEEEPVIFEVAAVQPARTVASRMIQAKGSVVTIPKRIPPPLPIRNPARSSRAKAEIGDVSGLYSPMRTGGFTPSEASFPELSESPTTPRRLSVKSVNLPKVESPLPRHTRSSSLRVESLKSTERLRSNSLKSSESKTSLSDKDVDVREEVDTNRPEITISMAGEEKSDAVFEEMAPEIPKRGSRSSATQSSPVVEAPELKKDTMSIDTGLSEDRSSAEESSYTTPTSDRPYLSDDFFTDDTPKKSIKEPDTPISSEEEVKKIEAADALAPKVVSIA